MHLPLLVKYCQLPKVLVLHHLTVQALPVKFFQLLKVLPLLHHVPLARFFLLLSLLERVHLLHSHQPLLVKFCQLPKVLPVHHLTDLLSPCQPVCHHSVQPPAKSCQLLKVQPVHHLTVQPRLCLPVKVLVNPHSAHPKRLHPPKDTARLLLRLCHPVKAGFTQLHNQVAKQACCTAFSTTIETKTV